MTSTGRPTSRKTAPLRFNVIIPARYASTRFPGKPLADLGGKPMVVRVAEQAARSGAAAVVVATDHDGIAEAVSAHGYDVVMTRSDHPTGTDRLAEAARKLGYGPRAIVVNVQGDEPLIPPRLIRQVAKNLADHADAAIATACHPIADAAEMFNPNAVKVVFDQLGYALYFSRAPIPYARDAWAGASRPDMLPDNLPAYRHLGIYAYRCGFLAAFRRLKPAALEKVEALEQLRALACGYRISVAVTRGAPHPGIDTPADLEHARAHWVR